MQGLIFRVDELARSVPHVEVTFPKADIVDSLAVMEEGMPVAVGSSVIPGIWTVLARGRLARVLEIDSVLIFRIEELFHFDSPIDVVTEGESESDAAFRPYNLDTLFGADVERVFGVQHYRQPAETHMMMAADAGVWGGYRGGVVHGGLELALQDSSFFYQIANAYDWRCGFTSLSQVSRDGLERDGLVFALEAPFWGQGAISSGMFMSGSIAFAYRHGYLAIGDDYEILRSTELDARLRTILDVINPAAKVVLPKAYENWPDLEAVRRHRLHFGY